MTKAAPTDFETAIRDVARALGYEIIHLTASHPTDPLTWHVELNTWQQRLKTLHLLTSLWQDRLDHDAEADRQAKREEETSDLY